MSSAIGRLQDVLELIKDNLYEIQRIQGKLRQCG